MCYAKEGPQQTDDEDASDNEEYVRSVPKFC